jgi:hypothetical protein
MKISFVESMQGSLRDESGDEHPVRFRVAASGSGGNFELRGLVTLPPWVQDAEAEGTLTMSIAPPRLSYRLRFGNGLTLEADKHPTPLSPLRSMTFMRTVVRDAAGKTLAEGPMTFALRDLPQFLASWLPFGRRQQHDLDAEVRAAARKELLSPR